jgi:ketosteroid isomerase-like protein
MVMDHAWIKSGARARGRLAAMLASVLLAASPAHADDYADLVAAERAFAADASARTTREAFLAALAPDGLVFAPGPTSGRHSWQSRTDDGGKLAWAPAFAEISAAGDLGYTGGPWTFTPKGADAPAAAGHYLSVWRKGADGRWSLVIDHGIGHAAQPFPDTVVRRGSLAIGAPPTWPVGASELRSADLLPAGELNARLVSADFLRLRNGGPPDAKAEGTAMPSGAARIDTGQVIAASGELAASWGGGEASPAWLRIWRRPSASDAPGKGWVLAVDLSRPAPPRRDADGAQ